MSVLRRIGLTVLMLPAALVAAAFLSGLAVLVALVASARIAVDLWRHP